MANHYITIDDTAEAAFATPTRLPQALSPVELQIARPMVALTLRGQLVDYSEVADGDLVRVALDGPRSTIQRLTPPKSALAAVAWRRLLFGKQRAASLESLRETARGWEYFDSARGHDMPAGSIMVHQGQRCALACRTGGAYCGSTPKMWWADPNCPPEELEELFEAERHRFGDGDCLDPSALKGKILPVNA